jgi:hypothetical protein
MCAAMPTCNSPASADGLDQKRRGLGDGCLELQQYRNNSENKSVIIFVLGSGTDKAESLNQYTKHAERGIETTGHGSTYQARQETTTSRLCAQTRKIQETKGNKH